MIPPCMFLVWGGFSDTTWNAYPPYSILKAPGPAADMWIVGLKLLGLSSVLGAINFTVTILKMKHPDLTVDENVPFCLGNVGDFANDYRSNSYICSLIGNALH